MAALCHGYMPIVYHMAAEDTYNMKDDKMQCWYSMKDVHNVMACGTSADGLRFLQKRQPDYFDYRIRQKENIARCTTLYLAEWPVIEWCFEQRYLLDEWPVYHYAVDAAYIRHNRRSLLTALYRYIIKKKGAHNTRTNPWPTWAVEKLVQRTKEFMFEYIK